MKKNSERERKKLPTLWPSSRVRSRTSQPSRYQTMLSCEGKFNEPFSSPMGLRNSSSYTQARRGKRLECLAHFLDTFRKSSNRFLLGVYYTFCAEVFQLIQFCALGCAIISFCASTAAVIEWRFRVIQIWIPLIFADFVISFDNVLLSLFQYSSICSPLQHGRLCPCNEIRSRRFAENRDDIKGSLSHISIIFYRHEIHCVHRI